VLENFELEGKSATRYVLAPEAWDGWGQVPKAFVSP
jgi:hypothetical protein